MSLFDAVILGVIEGFTEFLPVSSTAHLILASRALGLEASNFVKTFEIAIQSGAILGVLALYWRKFLDPRIAMRVMAAFVPTGILGVLFHSFIKSHLLESIPITLAALALGGALLILFERTNRPVDDGSDVRAITWRQSVVIGACQSVAMVPGVSRAAATIVGGMLLGIPKKAIVEFSFLLAVPTMFAATGYDLLKSASGFSSADGAALGLGFLSAMLTAVLGVKFLLSYIGKHSFASFGVYRIVLAVIFLLLFL